MEDPEINLQGYSHLIFDKGVKKKNTLGKGPLGSGDEEAGYLHAREGC